MSAGTLFFEKDLTLDTTSILQIEIGGLGLGESDLIDVSGLLTLGGTLELLFIDDFQNTVTEFDTLFFLEANSIVSDFDNIFSNQITTVDGLGQFDLIFENNMIGIINFVPVPEPQTYALIGIFMLGIVTLQRKFRNKGHAHQILDSRVKKIFFIHR